MTINERARAAKDLRDFEPFKLFIQEVRDAAMSAFATSGKSQTDIREEAHAELRAITRIVGTLDAAIAEQTNAEKRLKNGK